MVNKILGSRGIGKSSQLMEYACTNNIHYILCTYPKHHLELASEKGYEGLTFLRYDDSFVEELKRKNIPFLIDDLDIFLLKKYPTLKGYTNSIDEQGEREWMR